MADYERRLIVPITEFSGRLFTKNQTLVAKGYDRIVIGGRGPYVEFSMGQIVLDSFHVPVDQQWRWNSSNSYYVEYRSKDDANVKLYYQMKLVDYADYKLNYFYITPFDLYLQDGRVLIEPLKRKKK